MENSSVVEETKQVEVAGETIVALGEQRDKELSTIEKIENIGIQQVVPVEMIVAPFKVQSPYVLLEMTSMLMHRLQNMGGKETVIANTKPVYEDVWFKILDIPSSIQEVFDYKPGDYVLLSESSPGTDTLIFNNMFKLMSFTDILVVCPADKYPKSLVDKEARTRELVIAKAKENPNKYITKS